MLDWYDNLCQPCILVLGFWVLEYIFQIWLFKSEIYAISNLKLRCIEKCTNAYILCKRRIRLLEEGNCRYIFLCDYLLYKKHLKRKDFPYTTVDILFVLKKGLNNHIFHYRSSQNWRSIQPQCKKPTGCLANQVDIRKQLCELQLYSLLGYHK